ncbi:MAG: flippase-like domain-containing protein [Candidatus Omnitrophica bacterium]|nr:flippase-like domain-containing protein [Candidatus Omnitrophota bacterium]
MFRKAIKLGFIFVVTMIFVFYLKNNYHQIKSIFNIKPWYLFLIVALNFLNKLMVGYKTKRIMESFKIKLSFIEWLGSSIIVNFYNYLAPKSGTAVIGVYFKNKHSLNYSKYMGIVLTSSLVTVFTLGLFGFAAGIYLFLSSFQNLVFVILFFILLMLTPLILFFFPRIYFARKHVFKIINKVLRGWHILRKDKKMLFLLFVLDLGVLFTLAFRYYILFKIFSINATMVKCILIAPLNMLMHFATFVPGGYGVKEAAVGIVSRLVGLGFDRGVLTTLGDRVVNMVISFILGPIFSLLLFKHIFVSKKEVTENE